MPGYNHPDDCPCGWCVKDGSRTSSYSSRPLPVRIDVFTSYVNPHARCPVCGEPVYFYQSPYGGRVYFDDLGPPWPKHPCTISEYSPVVRIKFGETTNEKTPQWQVQGWIPLQVLKVHEEGEWLVVSGKIIETSEPVRFVVHGKPAISESMPAAFSGWNSAGVTVLSYLRDHGRGTGSVIGYRYADFVFEMPGRLDLGLAGLISRWEPEA